MTRSLGKSGFGADEVGHDIEGIADDDDDGIGRVLFDVVGHAADDLGVFEEEIVAAHAGLPGKAAGDDDDVGSGVIGGVIGALDVAVEAFEAGGLEHVEGLALGHAFDDVVEDDVAQFLFGQTLRSGGADKTGPDDGDLHSFMYQVSRMS